MWQRFSIFIFCLIALYSVMHQASAQNHIVQVYGGETHFRGSLAESTCIVSTESRDMHVNMGQYSNTEFKAVGSESTRHIPFFIHLTDCNPKLTENLGISFFGITDPKEPDAFLVTSGDGSPVGISGNAGFSGLGLIISDTEGNIIVPDTAPQTTLHPDSNEVVIPLTARYRATSRDVYPGPLHSDVDFRLVYP